MYIGKMVYTFDCIEVLPILCYVIGEGRCCISLKWERYVTEFVLRFVEKEVGLI